MRHKLPLIAALVGSGLLLAYVSRDDGLGLEPGIYSSVLVSNEVRGDETNPTCGVLSMPIEITKDAASYIGGACQSTPLKKDGDGYSLNVACTQTAFPSQTSYRLLPKSEREFTLSWNDTVDGLYTSTHQRCEYDFATATRMRDEALAKAQASQAPASSVAQQDRLAYPKCEALAAMNMPEEFAAERILMSPPGNSVFGSASTQEFLNDLLGPSRSITEHGGNRQAQREHRRKEAEAKADLYRTSSIGGLVCTAASRKIQISFETGWFSSTPQRLIATSLTGDRNSISSSLANAGDGPGGATRWFLTDLEVDGEEVDLPKETSGSVLSCLMSSDADEKILGIGATLLGALLDDDVPLAGEAGEMIGDSILSANNFCSPIRAHLGLKD